MCVFVHPLVFWKSRVFETLVFRARAHAPTLASSLRFFSSSSSPPLRRAPHFVSLPPSVFVVHVLTCRSPFVSHRWFAFLRPSRVYRAKAFHFSLLRARPLFTVFPSFSLLYRCEYLAIFLAVHAYRVSAKLKVGVLFRVKFQI